MKAVDFEYDGLTLSGFGFMICDFNGGGSETVSNGSEITFHTEKTLNGTQYHLFGATYDTCLEATFQICKDICTEEPAPITTDEIRLLSRWLNRKNFRKLKFLDEEFLNFYTEASFNINLIKFDGLVYGLELTMITNRPFLLQEPRHIIINNTSENGKHIFLSDSDEEGFIYPHTEITVNQTGTLQITNAREKHITLIKNCTEGEMITMDYPLISSSNKAHKIQKDFNWNFIKILNSFENSRNELTVSLPCSIKMIYSPAAKAGI